WCPLVCFLLDVDFSMDSDKALWCMPVVPATREAEGGGSLEPRSSGLQCTKPIHHCTPAWAASLLFVPP
uniref:Uncharacterized protein n=1 Tax=Sus scrofa TaxID=9823 RepID=A0A8D1UTX1_PIG